MKRVISGKEIEHIARLARLAINLDEKKEFTIQLNSILDYFKKISELNTDNIEPTAYIISKNNRYNEDLVGDSLPQKEVFSLGPFMEKGFFKAPRIME
ncbi:MAG: Asp-tRNA(Asn)/Glu-tRNA(Gln) amidotransferase subunit GatC [Candidatus Caldatribacteriota bacterium]